MEDIVREIQNISKACGQEQVEEKVNNWCGQFKSRGISIIALEALLNVPRVPALINTSLNSESFCFVDVMQTTHNYTEENENLRKEVDQLRLDLIQSQSRLKRIKKMALTFIIAALIIIGFLLIK